MIDGERVTAILAAGGSGQRAGTAKQWLALGGETVLRRAARAMAECPEVDALVAVVPAGEEGRGDAELAGLGKPARAVPGGAARADSVRNGLAAAADAAVVLVHDAARPFASPALASRVARAAAMDGAALAALAVTDTVKRQDGDALRVAATLDRSRLWLAQTPQGFRRTLLVEAYERAGEGAGSATDECLLVEQMGAPVTLVPGEAENFKITSPEDVARARAQVAPQGAPEAVAAARQSSYLEALARGGEVAPVAVGIGYDTHRFAEGRKLVLGGVEFEGDGLLGHSDADACAHAIGDAILGAAGLGDLGRHFPDTDPQWKGVSSLVLLQEIARRAGERGFRVGNADVTLAARRPKIAPQAEEMRARLAGALGIAPGQVNVKATTGEGMGFVGRGEGIAAHAVVVLFRSGR